MERRDRRHKASSKAPSSVLETKPEPGKKPAKLVLKAPATLSPPAEKKPRVSTLLDDCLSSETPEEALEQLLSITSADMRSLQPLAERGLGVLCELWRRWREREDVCMVIVRVFVELVTSGGGECGEGERDFALQLPLHELYSVKVLGLAAVRRLSQMDPALVPNALTLAHKEIHSVHHAVRVECLNLIGQLGHVTSDSEASLVTLEEYCSDPDPRVRAVSLQGLLEKQRHGVALPKTVYQKACDSLLDDDEDVRTVAVQLISALVRKSPEVMVSVPQKPPVPPMEVRMCDDAFARVCDLLNDVSMSVRALAAGLLGGFHSVSPQLLRQTLDKKLMSHLKGVKSDHERQKEQHAAGGGGGASGFDSGRTWGAAVPKLDLDLEERSLMSAGACGAFVHGLEDEYLEVRSAAVASMCQLGTRYLSFAAHCVDFLVDMFNDEIQTVRLSAINSLRQVSATVQLREDQMETVLGVLEESSADIREAMHSLLSTCQITTVPALRTTVHNLLDNLKKYSCDRESIWRCLQRLGSNHGHLVSCLVPELLNSHPFLMGKEPDVDDAAYVCILILVFNAAALCPTIPPLLPSHVFRHYTYLRDALPHLIPHVSVGMPSTSACKLGLPEKHADRAAVAHGFLQQVLCRAQTTLPPSSPSLPSPCSLAHRHQVLGTCISDLVRVGSLDDQLSDRANCAATVLQCQVLDEEISEALSQDLLLLPSDGRLGPAHTEKSITELMILSYRLESLCQGIGAELVGGVKITRLTAHAMQLLLAVQLDMDTEQSKEFMDMKLRFQHRLKILAGCVEGAQALPQVVKPLVGIDYVTIATDSLMEALQPLITAPLYPSLSPSDLVSVRMARATIHEPQNFSQDDHTRFVYSLALSIPVQATLYNVARATDVAIQLRFPDNRRLLFTPKPSDLRRVGLHETRLDTAVVTSHGLWTDPCQVELCIGVRVHTDVPETTHLSPTSAHNLSSHSASTLRSNSSRVQSHSEDSMDPGHCFLAISDVIKINIFPQETASHSFNVFGGP